MNGKSTEVGRKFVAYGDVLRMIASAMVVMLHCISPYVKSTAFYGARSWVLFVALDATCRAGVPLFFMLSGAMLLSRDETEGTLAFYRRKIPPVLVLIVFWDIFYYLYDFLFFYGQENFSLRELINRMFNNGTEYHIWYLYTLVGIYLTAPFLKKALARCSECETVILSLYRPALPLGKSLKTDFPHGIRFQREIYSASLARRSGTRQEIAYRQVQRAV